MEEWGLSSNSWFNFKNILAAITKKKKKKKKKKKISSDKFKNNDSTTFGIFNKQKQL